MVRRNSIAGLFIGAIFVLMASTTPAGAQTATGRFAGEIAALTQNDAIAAAHCPIMFVGSSSIRLWRGLSDDMAPVATLNRGFGGAGIGDINANFNTLVARPRPWAIFFYAGENDIADGAAANAVVSAFAEFLAMKDATLGATPVYFISLKPSVARFEQLSAQTAVNNAVRRMARERDDLIYIDVARAMLDHGRPRDIFVEDGLHMSERGYAIWTEIIRPHVLREAARTRPLCAPLPSDAPAP